MDRTLILTFSSELKDLVANEVISLGATLLEQKPKAIYCTVDEKTFYKIHLRSSLADQIHLFIKTFSGKSPEMIFDQVRRIRWHEWIHVDKEFSLQFSSEQPRPQQEKVFKKIIEGIRDSVKHYAGKDIKYCANCDTTIVVHQDAQSKITLSLNTSGRSLHKRGYRQKGHLAPLKENKARALLHWANYDGIVPLWDPFCGSGTIVIEAAYIAMDKATHIHRTKGNFGFEHLPLFDKQLWREAQDEARLEKKEFSAFIRGSDIDGPILTQAKENALRARVERNIKWEQLDFFSSLEGNENGVPTTSPGLIVSNLPYNKRLDLDDDQLFYKKLGDHLKKHFSGWRACFLVPKDSPWKLIGLKPKMKREMSNGAIECFFICFDLW